MTVHHQQNTNAFYMEEALKDILGIKQKFVNEKRINEMNVHVVK